VYRLYLSHYHGISLLRVKEACSLYRAFLRSRRKGETFRQVKDLYWRLSWYERFTTELKLIVVMLGLDDVRGYRLSMGKFDKVVGKIRDEVDYQMLLKILEKA